MRAVPAAIALLTFTYVAIFQIAGAFGITRRIDSQSGARSVSIVHNFQEREATAAARFTWTKEGPANVEIVDYH